MPAVLLQKHGPAPGRQHDALERGQRLDGLALALPETRLTLLLEDERDVDAGAPLDLRITVVEGQLEHARHVAAHGGLAGAHGPDEENTGPATHMRRQDT